MTRDSAARPPRPARPALALSLLVATSCTNLLGIDGNYVAQPEQPDHSGGAGGEIDDSGGAGAGGRGDGGAGGTGGDSPGTGGTGGENDGGAPDSGGANTGCAPGTFSGTFTGAHKPTVTFVGVQGSVKNGTWSFELVGTGGTLAVASGAFQGDLTSVSLDSGTIDGTFDGSLDCKTGTMGGTLSGTVHVLSAIPATFQGTWDGSFANSVFEGTWTENEPKGTGGAPGTCIPGMDAISQPIGSGCGKWNAH